MAELVQFYLHDLPKESYPEVLCRIVLMQIAEFERRMQERDIDIRWSQLHAANDE